MGELSVLIVEDDLIIASHISSVIEEAGYQVLEVLTKGESVDGFLENQKVDVVLMDINLAGQQDGIETAKILNQSKSVPIIFLTANVDKATFEKSKEAFPHAFLAKPFKSEDLIRTLELLFNTKKDNEASTKEQASEIKTLDDRIFVRDKNKLVKLKIEDILYVEAERNYCSITTRNKKYTLSVPLKKFENKVANDLFVRIHRSYMVNLKAIDEIDENYVFIDGQSLPISKSHKQELNRRLTLI